MRAGQPMILGGLIALSRSATTLAVSVLLAIGIGLGGVLAHEGATGVIKQRMDAMKAMATAMKTVGGMMKGEASYDAAKAALSAREIGDHSGIAMIKLFPKGSLHPPSEAKGEIWQDWAKFEQEAHDLGVAAKDFEATVTAGADVPEPMRAAFRRLGQSCVSCHERFRQKTN